MTLDGWRDHAEFAIALPIFELAAERARYEAIYGALENDDGDWLAGAVAGIRAKAARMVDPWLQRRLPRFR